MANVTVRQAEVADAEIIHRFSVKLAEFEGTPNAVVASIETMVRDGFGPNAAFRTLIAEIDGAPVGFATYTNQYSVWEGKGTMFLQDLWVMPEVRQQGVARALMQVLARECCSKGHSRIDLNVLDWNPARRFYENVGCRHLDRSRPYRLHGDALTKLAATEPGKGH